MPFTWLPRHCLLSSHQRRDFFSHNLVSSDFRTVHKHTSRTARVITIQRRWWLRWWLSFDGPLISIRHACVSFEVMRSGKKSFHGHFPKSFPTPPKAPSWTKKRLSILLPPSAILRWFSHFTAIIVTVTNKASFFSFLRSWVWRRSAENKSIRATREN